jgi:citrate lyase beta subunit
MTNFDYLKLGASLYVPATREDIAAIANNDKLPGLRSVIFCLEDSILERDVASALANLDRALQLMTPQEGKLRFIRVRNPEVLTQCLHLSHIYKIDGFVLPKTTLSSFKEYQAVLPAGSSFKLMPTLETREALDMAEMVALRTYIIEQGLAPQILSLRIGGNDLLNLYGLRRSSTRTIYDSPLRTVISQLVSCFRPYGFNLTAPVCELLYERDILNTEVSLDLDHGMFGKTAVHPDQIALIEEHFRVSAAHVEAANEILDKDAPAVFQRDNAMCEPATHRNWAEAILARARIYGVHGERQRLVLVG